METTSGLPFTSSQCKELERQTMIYKYMMDSVPVPPHLLLPITQNLSPESHFLLNSNGSILKLSKGLEPERCKRTDGKKWRCSRDVAPYQKYCERHVHKARPHSRKPVEVHAPNNNVTTTTTNKKKKKTRTEHHHFLATTPMPVSKYPSVHSSISSPLVLGSTIQPNDEYVFDSSYKQHSRRGLDWIMGGEMVKLDTSKQQWQHLMQTNIPLTRESSMYNTFQQVYKNEPLNLVSYTDFGAHEAHQENIDSPNLFLNPNIMDTEKQPQMETPKGFIDAWSYDNASINNNKNMLSVSSKGEISFSSLTLSMAMAAGNALDEEMGLGLTDSDVNYGIGGNESNDKPQVLTWFRPVPLVASAPAGPLAEVLRPNSDSTSTPASTVSSPFGILQRTMLSLSDSSGCNSPTLAASTAMPNNMAFQQLN